MTYVGLSGAEQIEVLRPVAMAAADRFGLDVARMEVVAHAYNTTFAADTADGVRYAMRVNTNSHSTPENVVAQQAWQRAISADTDVQVPDPLATPEGDWFVTVDSEVFGRSLTVTAASWLAGSDVSELDVDVTGHLGRTMALLHEQSRGWAWPDGAAFPRFDTPLFGDEDLLHSAPGLDADERAVLRRAHEEATHAFARVYAGAPVQPLHADLHGGNLKWDDGRIAVFDFDDSGLGVPALDLAVTTFYLRDGSPAPEQSLRAGYAEVGPLPDLAAADFEALVAARQLLLANSLLAITTAELRSDAARYLDVTIARLRHWLATGTFTRTVPGA
jgi:Ser/Thr protein kinase RdoA (MazF antagonist)